MDFRLEYVGPHGLHTPDGHKTKGEEFTADEQWVHGNAHLITGPHPLIEMVNRDELRAVQLTKRAPALHDHERNLREPGDVFEAPEIWLAGKCPFLRSGRLVEVEAIETDGDEGEGEEVDNDIEPGEGESLGGFEEVEGAVDLPTPEQHDDLTARLKALGWPTLQKLTSALREATEDTPEAQGTDPYIAFALKHFATTLELLSEYEA